MKKILITGVAGLVGSRLAEYLVNNKTEIEITGIDDLSGGLKENIPKGINFRQLDINDELEIDKLFNDYQFDIVYHFAAYAAEGLSPFIRRFNYHNNIIGSATIINACIKYNVSRIIFASSIAVYGNGTPPFTEDTPINPIDPYGVAKAAVEMDLKIAYEQHGLDYSIVRMRNIYGKNQNIFDPYRNFIGIAIYKSLVGDPITIYGDGLQLRNFSEMTDSLEPLWEIGISKKTSTEIINLGGIKKYSVLETAKIVQELSGAKIVHLPERHEVKNAYCSNEKSVQLLNFEHKTDLYDGVKNMYEWAKTLPLQDRFIWKKYELEKGMYDFWKRDNLTK